MFYLPDIPRNERTVLNYVDALMTRAAIRCVALDLFETREQFYERIVHPVLAMVLKGSITGETILANARNDQYLELVSDARLQWAVLCATFASQALIADKAGETTNAWSYLMDASACRDGIIESTRELEVASAAMRSNTRFASKHPRKRKSPYSPEHPRWVREAKAALAKREDLTVPEIADAIKATGTHAAVRHLRKWVSDNEDAIRKAGRDTARIAESLRS